MGERGRGEGIEGAKGNQLAAVKGNWILKGPNRAGYRVTGHDPGRELIIDPIIFSTYFGGSSNDLGNGIALDPAGNIYVVGTTTSTPFLPSFPTAGAYQTTFGGSPNDAMIVKLNPAGSAVVYSTYLGGVSSDEGRAIAVDGAGNAYVTGRSTASFPTTAGAFQTTGAGAFVTKLNPAGSALVYSTMLAGIGADFGNAIAVDAAGNAYVTGSTNSPGFPTTAGAFQFAFSGGPPDAFVTKVNPTGTALVYSTFLGGSSGGSQDSGNAIAVDAAGNAYIAGQSSSDDFPVTAGAYLTTRAGGNDAFVTKLNPTGTALIYSTFLGGTNSDIANGIAVDGAGNAYIAGQTLSATFPTTAGAFQTTWAGGSDDAFVTKLNPGGSALVYSTFLGGAPGIDRATAIAIDGAGNAYVAGVTNSNNFPTVNPVGVNSSGSDIFVSQLNAAGNTLVFSTYLGGTGGDGANGIALDASGAIVVVGSTNSPTVLPIVNPLQATFGGGPNDLYIAKMTAGVPPPPPPPPGPVGTEGSYGGAVGNGGLEGTYGFGGARMRFIPPPPRAPLLQGPFLGPPGGELSLAGANHIPWAGAHLTVLNVSHRQKTQSNGWIAEQEAAQWQLLGWVLLSGATLALMVVLAKKFKP